MRHLWKVNFACAAICLVCGVLATFFDSSGWWQLVGPGDVGLAVGSVVLGIHNYRRTHGSNRSTEANRQDSEAGGNARYIQRALTAAIGAIGPAQATGTGLEVVERAEPIRAWRGIQLVADGNTVRLGSLNTCEAISPVEQRAYCAAATYAPYVTYTVVGHRGLVNPVNHPQPSLHAAPDPSCSCGLYAVKDIAKCAGSIFAEVDLYGTVIDHEGGYRAEYQRVLSLRIPRESCQGGFLCDEAPDLMAFPVDVTTVTSILGGQPYESVYKSAPIGVCQKHACDYERVATLGQIAARLGVEVRWHDANDANKAVS